MAKRTAQGKLLIFSAPSGAGKTTITRELVRRRVGVLSVSYTTRKRHSSESDGVDYFFVTKNEFMRLRDNGELLEHAIVHSNFYGTGNAWIVAQLNSGNSVILELDVCGAAQIRGCKFPSVHVFIIPPSLAILEERLRARAREDPKTIWSRLRNARKELLRMGNFDYLIVNDAKSRAIHDALAITECATGGRRSAQLQRAAELETGNRGDLVDKWHKLLSS